MDINWLIEHFGLEELPVEGGIFYQTYLSEDIIPAAALPDRYKGDKPLGTAILFLLTADPDSFSALHKLPTDEIYHFYLGDPVEMLNLYADGRSERILLGQDLKNGQHIQYTVARDVWQGSHLLPGGEWALLGTTMAPAFTNDDYQGGDREELIALYPEQSDLIIQLTRPERPLHITA
jgi:uncharacterized protein